MLQLSGYEVQRETDKVCKLKKEIMVWSNLHEHDLTNSVLLLHTMNWDIALLITLYL